MFPYIFTTLTTTTTDLVFYMLIFVLAFVFFIIGALDKSPVFSFLSFSTWLLLSQMHLLIGYASPFLDVLWFYYAMSSFSLILAITFVVLQIYHSIQYATQKEVEKEMELM
jgi:hypothetical protein